MLGFCRSRRVADFASCAERTHPQLNWTTPHAAVEESLELQGIVKAPDRGALPQLLPELWREVLSYFRIPAATLLSRQDPSLFRTSHYGDLARFSLVNSTFAELVAPFLYERLHYAVPRTAERWLAGTRSSIRYHSKGKVTPLLRDLTVVGARRHGLDTDQLQNEIMLDCYRNLTRLKLCWITGAQLGAVSFPNLRVLTLMDIGHGFDLVSGAFPHLQHLGLLQGAGLLDSTSPLDQALPSLVSLAIGRRSVNADDDNVHLFTGLNGAAYDEAAERLFHPLCSTLRHLALDGHPRNLSAWEPMLTECTSLVSLRVFNLREEWIAVLRRLDLPSLSLLHLDVLNPREAPPEERARAQIVRDPLIKSCFELMEGALGEGRFASLKIYVGGVTNDLDYPQRHTRLSFPGAPATSRSVEDRNPRVVDAFTRRDDWDPLGDKRQFKLLEM